MRWQRHGGVAANSLLGYSLEVSWWRGWWRPSGGAPRWRGALAGDVVAWIVSSRRCGGVAGGAGCRLHVRSAPGGVGGGQGETLDDDVCERAPSSEVSYVSVSQLPTVSWINMCENLIPFGLMLMAPLASHPS